MYLFAHNCSHIQSSGDKNSPSGRTEVSISLVHHNYPSPEENSAKMLYKVRNWKLLKKKGRVPVLPVSLVHSHSGDPGRRKTLNYESVRISTSVVLSCGR